LTGLDAQDSIQKKGFIRRSEFILSLIRWLIIFIFIGILIWHASVYLPFFSDDALISLRYAENLIHGEGLRWTPGPPIEGYSNLLWILIIALWGALGADLIVASRVFGVLFMSVVVVAVAYRSLNKKSLTRSWLGFFYSMIFFVGAAPIAVWAIGGLEQPLIAAALSGVILLYWRASDRDFKEYQTAGALSFMLGVLCLARPDGIIYTCAIFGSMIAEKYLFKRRVSRPFLLIVLSLPLLAYGGQLVFRLLYYGEWIPNSALVKIAPSLLHFKQGLSYVLSGLVALFPSTLIVFVILGLSLFSIIGRRRFLPIIIIFVSWCGYLIGIGGDVFPAYRHLIPVVVIMTFILAEGTDILADRFFPRGTRKKIASILILLSLVLSPVFFQYRNPEFRKAKEEIWEWYGRSLGLTLKKAFYRQQPLLAVTAAGCLPYWSGFPCVDMLGLNDYYLPRHKPDDFGSGWLGHELGDGNYVLQRSPDIIVFGVGSEPNYRSGIELASNSEFNRRYVRMPVRTAVPPLYTAVVWLKKDSHNIGLKSSDSRIIIPAYFMNSFGQTAAYLHNGKLVIGVAANAPAGIRLENVPKGSTVTVISEFATGVDCSVNWEGDRMQVVLTSRSENPIPVEKILVSNPKTRE